MRDRTTQNAFKPAPVGFQRACKVWRLVAEEVLYVGDRPNIDRKGTAAAGMRRAIVGPLLLGRASMSRGIFAMPDFASLAGFLGLRC